MDSLNGPADTPLYFLIGAGIIMVIALTTSKKAQNVAKTEIGLGSQQSGEEMFGSSRIARRTVRWALQFFAWVRRVTPPRMRRWFNRRFDVEESVLERGAAFDLVRGSVNLVLAGALIALGTSMKLPLSTTFVTFMVAMGPSLADRAWGRESAVFRITGVISVIGGWFLTAGAAFIGAGLIVTVMHFGGLWAMMAFAVLTILLILHSNRRFKSKQAEETGDTLFQTILATEDKQEAWALLQRYTATQQQEFIAYASNSYREITGAFLHEDIGTLEKSEVRLMRRKEMLKNVRRKETLCIRKINRETAIEKSTWFYLINNNCMSVFYNLRRINEIYKEHVGNNFLPLPSRYVADFENIRIRVSDLFGEVLAMMEASATDTVPTLRRRCDNLKDTLSATSHSLHDHLYEGDSSSMTVLYVYLNTLQETQEIVSSIRKYLRAYAHLTDNGTHPAYDKPTKAQQP